MKTIIFAITVLQASYIQTDYYLRVVFYFLLKMISITLALQILKLLNLVFPFVIPLGLTLLFVELMTLDKILHETYPNKTLLFLSSLIVASPAWISYLVSFFTRSDPETALAINQIFTHVAALAKIIFVYCLLSTLVSSKVQQTSMLH